MDNVNDKDKEGTILKNKMKQEPLNELGITLEQRYKLIEEMSEGIELTISKVRETQNIEFKKGFGFVIKNFEELGLAAVEEIAYPRTKYHEEVLFDLIPAWDIAKEILESDENDNGFFKIHYKVSYSFIQGMTEAAKILLGTSKPRLVNEEKDRMLTIDALFKMELVDFAYAIIKTDAIELQCHMLGAYLLVGKLSEQLEDLSHQIIENEKHGSGKKY
jgi:hypothetical protein